MSQISTYLSDKLLDHSFGTAAYTEPTVYGALFTVAPTMPAGTGGTEVSGGSYVREEITGSMAAAASQANASNANITWPTATGSWGTVVGLGIYDANMSGNLLWYGNLTSSQAVGIGDTFSVPSGDLTATIS